MTNSKKSERIYITAKTRMVAEERARDVEAFLNGLTAWYAFSLIAVSVANLAGQLRFGTVEFTATLLSIALFGISLFLLGGRVSQKADEFRKCYLALKEIYHSSRSEDEKMESYNEELEKFPNHKPIDYDLMVHGTLSRGQTLWNDEGKISLTSEMENRVRRHKVLVSIAKIVAVTLPGILFGLALVLSASLNQSRLLPQTPTDLPSGKTT